MWKKIKSLPTEDLKIILNSFWHSLNSGIIKRTDMYDSTYTMEDWEEGLASELTLRGISLTSI